MGKALKPKPVDTAKLATDAFEKSGCQSHREFCQLFDGAIGLRTFRDWLDGKKPTPLAVFVLRRFLSGRWPKCRK